jgi:hypothetical protein
MIQYEEVGGQREEAMVIHSGSIHIYIYSQTEKNEYTNVLFTHMILNCMLFHNYF